MSKGRVPLRVLCVRDSGGGLVFMATPEQLRPLSRVVRTVIDPEQGDGMTCLSPIHRYRYRIPPPWPPPFVPVDSKALHLLALSRQMPARVRPPSLAVGGSATCSVWSAAEWERVKADPFLSALVSD